MKKRKFKIFCLLISVIMMGSVIMPVTAVDSVKDQINISVCDESCAEHDHVFLECPYEAEKNNKDLVEYMLNEFNKAFTENISTANEDKNLDLTELLNKVFGTDENGNCVFSEDKLPLLFEVFDKNEQFGYIMAENGTLIIYDMCDEEFMLEKFERDYKSTDEITITRSCTHPIIYWTKISEATFGPDSSYCWRKITIFKHFCPMPGCGYEYQTSEATFVQHNYTGSTKCKNNCGM